MFVSNYHSHFIQLAWFAPHSEVPDEASRANRFQRGLKTEYEPFMASHEWGIVEEVHEAVLRLEREATDFRRLSDYMAR